MKQQEQLALIEQINAKGIELMKSKGHDYAGKDILKNFKQMQQVCSVLGIDTSKIEGIHMFYIILKIQRLCNLLFSNKVAKNESIQDTLIDLRNYVDLLNCTLEEKKTLAVAEEQFIQEISRWKSYTPLISGIYLVRTTTNEIMTCNYDGNLWIDKKQFTIKEWTEIPL